MAADLENTLYFDVPAGRVVIEMRPDLAPEHVARLCVAPLLLGALWRATFAQFDPKPYDIEALIETHIDVLMRGLAKDQT